ncbi:MAG: hypothetical protein WAZ77_22780 [Candidatus Nitrosopolaris sp.]|jgi:holliday junction DNA helicase RuvB
MARASKAPTHVLLTGLPASAKMMLPFMVPTTYKGVIFGSAGIIDSLFKNPAPYLIIHEIDKMPPRDQIFFLNLMETGIVSETRYGRTRLTVMKTSVCAISNDLGKLPARCCQELEPYISRRGCIC